MACQASNEEVAGQQAFSDSTCRLGQGPEATLLHADQ